MIESPLISVLLRRSTKELQAPSSQQELLERANHISGLTLEELANQCDIAIPRNLQREKGWVGQLLEVALGARAGSRPVPDFEHLGIEMKSIPVDRSGLPLETTYICVAPLTGVSGAEWHTSLVRCKLAKVLWMPILSERSIPLTDRIVGTPILWQPSTLQEQRLRQDWEELMDLIVLGHAGRITAQHGEVLQLRPKAANGQVRVNAFDHQGEQIQAQPKGFYLKKTFTRSILEQNGML